MDGGTSGKIKKIVKHRIIKSPSKNPTEGVLEIIFFESDNIKISTYPVDEPAKARVIYLSKQSAQLVAKEVGFQLGTDIKFEA